MRATVHAIDRGAERYGVVLRPSDMRAIAVKCRERNGERIHGDTRQGHEAWLVPWGGREMLAIYDRRQNLVITMAPWAGRSDFLLIKRVRVTRRGRELVGGVAQLLAHLGEMGGGHAGTA